MWFTLPVELHCDGGRVDDQLVVQRNLVSGWRKVRVELVRDRLS